MSFSFVSKKHQYSHCVRTQSLGLEWEIMRWFCKNIGHFKKAKNKPKMGVIPFPRLSQYYPVSSSLLIPGLYILNCSAINNQ